MGYGAAGAIFGGSGFARGGLDAASIAEQIMRSREEGVNRGRLTDESIAGSRVNRASQLANLGDVGGASALIGGPVRDPQYIDALKTMITHGRGPRTVEEGMARSFFGDPAQDAIAQLIQISQGNQQPRGIQDMTIPNLDFTSGPVQNRIPGATVQEPGLGRAQVNVNAMPQPMTQSPEQLNNMIEMMRRMRGKDHINTPDALAVDIIRNPSDPAYANMDPKYKERLINSVIDKPDVKLAIAEANLATAGARTSAAEAGARAAEAKAAAAQAEGGFRSMQAETDRQAKLAEARHRIGTSFTQALANVNNTFIKEREAIGKTREGWAKDPKTGEPLSRPLIANLERQRAAAMAQVFDRAIAEARAAGFDDLANQYLQQKQSMGLGGTPGQIQVPGAVPQSAPGAVPQGGAFGGQRPPLQPPNF